MKFCCSSDQIVFLRNSTYITTNLSVLFLKHFETPSLPKRVLPKQSLLSSPFKRGQREPHWRKCKRSLPYERKYSNSKQKLRRQKRSKTNGKQRKRKKNLFEIYLSHFAKKSMHNEKKSLALYLNGIRINWHLFIFTFSRLMRHGTADIEKI